MNYLIIEEISVMKQPQHLKDFYFAHYYFTIGEIHSYNKCSEIV